MASATTNATETTRKTGTDWVKIGQTVGFWALVIIIFLYTVFPFIWALNSSFKSEQAIQSSPTEYIPSEPILRNYEGVFINDLFVRGLFNSAIVAIISVALSLVIGAFAAYALGRLEFKGRTPMLYLVLSMTMFPLISILSGLFVIVRELNVYGSIVSMLITYPIFTLPFTVWVLTSFFQGLPADLERAALVDGASPFQTFYMILLPLTAPALVTTGLLAFIAAWNEYLLALTFTTTTPEAQTVPVAIARFDGQFARQEPIAEVMAASVVVTIPLVILVLIFQNRIVEGLTAGAVKG